MNKSTGIRNKSSKNYKIIKLVFCFCSAFVPSRDVKISMHQFTSPGSVVNALSLRKHSWLISICPSGVRQYQYPGGNKPEGYPCDHKPGHGESQ